MIFSQKLEYLTHLSFLGLRLFSVCTNNLCLSLSESASYLYGDDKCIFYQDKSIHRIKNVLSKDFSTLYEWFIDNMLSIHFVEDKTKCIFLTKTNRFSKLNVSYGNHIKQYLYTRIFRVSP